METQEHSVALSAAKGIEVARLEKELTAMWSTATDGHEDDEGREDAAASGVTRACVLNLVACTLHPDSRAKVDEVLDDVIEQHPARVLVLVIDQGGEPKLDAYVSTRCQLSSKGAKQICGEQITIEAGGVAGETLASAVAPLLIPDVPVFLWWKDVPDFDDKLFQRLAATADRVVIDSTSFVHPDENFLRLAEMISAPQSKVKLSDLSWGQLTAWRTLLASFWDVPEYRTHLDQIDQLEIIYEQPDASSGAITLRALLVVGWLGAQLGWQTESVEVVREDEALRFTMQTGARLVSVRLRATPTGEAGESRILAISLTSSAGAEARFHVALRPEGTKLVTGISIGGEELAVGRVLPYEVRREGERLSRELSFLIRDAAYEKAVTAAAHLVGAMRQRHITMKH